MIVLSSATWFFGVPNWALLSDSDVLPAPGEKWLGGVLTEEEKMLPPWDGKVEGTEEWASLDNIQTL